MADDSESSDRFCSRRESWELVSLEKADHEFEEASSSSTGSNEAIFYENKLIEKDYFAAPLTDASYEPNQRQAGDLNKAFLRIETVELPPCTTQHEDWIEPLMPVQSCVIGTSEDDESSSRSCSGDSREGSTEHLVREKDSNASTGFDTNLYVRDYAAVLHDVPMDVILESSIERNEAIDGASSGGHGGDAPRRRCLGAWLSEMRRTSPLWSITLAAAVIGLVLVGSGWQRIRLQCQRLRCHVFLKGKGISSQVINHLVQIKGSSSKRPRIALL